MEKLGDESKFAQIKTWFKESLSALAQDHKDWIEYDNLYLAKHWSDQRVSWRPDPVINYISYVVDQKAPQLTNSSPTGLILPTSQGDDEVAKLFTQVTEVITERADFVDKLDEVVRTGLLLGTGWFKVYWDNSITGGSQAKGNLFQGDVCIECPDPANIYHDPQANDVEDCRYIIYATLKPCKQIEQTAQTMLGQTIKVDPEQEFQTEIYNRPGKNAPKQDCAMWYECWEKDEQGVHCTYAAGGKILKRIEKASPNGRYPFVTFIPKKKRKSLLGIGEPKNLVNNQKLLNKLIEMPVTNMMFTANPMLLVKAANGIDPESVAAVPGRVYTVKDTVGAMDWVEPPSMPQDIYKLTDLMTTYIEKIGGIYDANTGATPTGVTAAAAIQMLQDQASIPIKGIGRNLNDTIKDVYELIIGLVKVNYTETRYIRVMDEKGNPEFKPFQGAQYAEIDLDVKISAGSSTPTSKAYIAQMSADLFEKGLLLPSEYVNMQDGVPDKSRIVERLREKEQNQEPPKDVPSISISFTDLPVTAKVQLLQQMGIQVNPQEIMQEMQLQQPQAKPESVDPHSPAMELTKMQLEHQAKQEAQKHDLTKIELQHQASSALSAQNHTQGLESSKINAELSAKKEKQAVGAGGKKN
jgi:hypothetical protein